MSANAGAVRRAKRTDAVNEVSAHTAALTRAWKACGCCEHCGANVGKEERLPAPFDSLRADGHYIGCAVAEGPALDGAPAKECA